MIYVLNMIHIYPNKKHILSSINMSLNSNKKTLFTSKSVINILNYRIDFSWWGGARTQLMG